VPVTDSLSCVQEPLVVGRRVVGRFKWEYVNSDNGC